MKRWKIWRKSKSNSEMIWKIWKKAKLNSEKIWKIQKKPKLNCEMIWKIWKKGKLKCEMIWQIWKKGKSNSEKIWKIQKKIVKRYEKYGRKVFFLSKQVWTQKCDFLIKKLILDYYFCLKSGRVFLFQMFIVAPLPLPRDIQLYH